MKNFLALLIGLTLMISACGGSSEKEDTSVKEAPKNLIEAQEQLESMRTEDFKEAKNCDEFIDQYEEWMDNYVDLLDRWKKNPADAAISQEYMKVSQEAINWVSQWNSHLAQCASQEKYEKRFNEISERAEKKLEAMGFE